jgi:hypothetical protein
MVDCFGADRLSWWWLTVDLHSQGAVAGSDAKHGSRGVRLDMFQNLTDVEVVLRAQQLLHNRG